MKKLVLAMCLTTILTNLAACGTILYPERRGNRGGRIDPAVAILDGVGLLLFIVPGLVAYAIDFATGTIYLPSGRGNSSLGYNVADNIDTKDMKAVHVGKENLSKENIAKVVYAETGKQISMNDANVEVYKVR